MTRTLGTCCLIEPKSQWLWQRPNRNRSNTQHMTHGPANSGRSVQHHGAITARQTCSQTHEATTPPCCQRGRHDAKHTAQALLLSLWFTEQTTLHCTPAKGTAHTIHEQHTATPQTSNPAAFDLQTKPPPLGTADSCTATSLRRYGPELCTRRHQTKPRVNSREGSHDMTCCVRSLIG